MPTLAILLILCSALMHAGWNLLVHAAREDRDLLIRINLVFGLMGLGPVLVAEWYWPTLTPFAWMMLAIAGVGQTIYSVGLSKGYRRGDFTIVYPLVRALPILFLAAVDIVRGYMPNLPGFAGIVLVMVGCVLLGMNAMRRSQHVRVSSLWFWIALAAAGTVCYSTADKFALDLMPKGINAALRYGVIEFLLSGLGASLCLRRSPRELWRLGPNVRWPKIFVAAFMLGITHVLLLWAYQLVDQISYVSAGRQISIAIGVVLAAWFLHERVGVLRIVFAIVIAAGVAMIALGGHL